MSWERRAGQLYYYRKVRRGGRRMRQYVGKGEGAELAAALDETRRRERELGRERRRREDERWRAAERALDVLGAVAGAVLRAALGRAGFAQHQRGEWRRRQKTMQTTAPTKDEGMPASLPADVARTIERARSGDASVMP